MTTHTWLRRGGVWFGAIVGFFVALHLIWPMPAGVIAWSVVFSSVIALLAIGIALIYRSHRVINFAMADLGAVPASVALTLVGLQGWSYWVAVPFALVVAVASGSATEFVVIRRFEKAPRLVLMVATIGLAQVLAGIAEAVPEIPRARDGSHPTSCAAVRVQPRHLADHPARQRPDRGDVDDHHVGRAVRVLALHQSRRRAPGELAAAPTAPSLLGVNVGLVHNVAWIAATLVAAVAMIMRAGVLGLPLGSAFGPRCCSARWRPR